ncbi:hypothetical protein DL762_004062 [Monosporascus cannonballus]|uniref:Protein MEMO1 n=1 Tax=Monosporascus cannonballus TaxID=155416 RepID=A0ABY0HCZ4_9PEZI|nr:hypothetical protein DL762_004062 [Monosporascus cannonballus]
MVLKRKRSESGFSVASSSALTSPPCLFASVMDIDFTSPSPSPSRPQSRSMAPTHLPGRTLKRFRDSRPSDELIHRRTLNMLYSAAQKQKQQQQQQQWPEEAMAQVQAQPENPHDSGSGSGQQTSLHSFWKLPPISAAASSASPPPVDRAIYAPTSCEDCGQTLAGEDGGGDSMDIDGLNGGEPTSCCACGKHVCSHCSVTNLGEQRRCLRCAGKKIGPGIGGQGWTSSGVGQGLWVGACSASSKLYNMYDLLVQKMKQRGTREASHAYSWYDGDPTSLSRQLDGFLEEVPDTINNSTLPISGAKFVIAPHAGYSYSGPCAAWAYKCLDLSKAKRIFVLGPSHTYYLSGCALTKFAKYETPFGNLTVDEAVVQELRDTGKFQDIPSRSDVNEHSLEMHLPYIYKRITQTFSSESEYPTIVPILVGDNNGPGEKEFGKLLAPYLKDPENAFVVSSDFCHWGSRFSYTAYAPEGDVQHIQSLSRRTTRPTNPPIHESIKQIDHLAMDAIESGDHNSFVDNLKHTKNTVCGRHPIGVMMAALEVLAKEGAEDGKYRFKFVQYQRSSLVEDVSDSSVSYASAYAIV